MSFTEAEQRAWQEEKRQREQKPTTVHSSTPIAVCIHCHNSFGLNEGVITDDVEMCYICIGD
jgi:hypothetical protein